MFLYILCNIVCAMGVPCMEKSKPNRVWVKACKLHMKDVLLHQAASLNQILL